MPTRSAGVRWPWPAPPSGPVLMQMPTMTPPVWAGRPPWCSGCHLGPTRGPCGWSNPVLSFQSQMRASPELQLVQRVEALLDRGVPRRRALEQAARSRPGRRSGQPRTRRGGSAPRRPAGMPHRRRPGRSAPRPPWVARAGSLGRPPRRPRQRRARPGGVAAAGRRWPQRCRARLVRRTATARPRARSRGQKE